jgi:hypothetical protein
VNEFDYGFHLFVLLVFPIRSFPTEVPEDFAVHVHNPPQRVKISGRRAKLFAKLPIIDSPASSKTAANFSSCMGGTGMNQAISTERFATAYPYKYAENSLPPGFLLAVECSQKN